MFGLKIQMKLGLMDKCQILTDRKLRSRLVMRRREMIYEGKSNSILVSGESGAGKTETTKMLMRYLAYLGGHKGTEGRTVEQQVLEASLANDYTASINRVIWSPDGTLFGVAYFKNIVHIYSYHGGNDVRNHLEIDAHSGSVNDLAFSYSNKQLSIVTCGEDRLIKVWDAVTENKQYTFEGHEAPVYSVCPHRKENI